MALAFCPLTPVTRQHGSESDDEAENSESNDEADNSHNNEACIGTISNSVDKKGNVLSPIMATQNDLMEYFKNQSRNGYQ